MEAKDRRPSSRMVVSGIQNLVNRSSARRSCCWYCLYCWLALTNSNHCSMPCVTQRIIIFAAVAFAAVSAANILDFLYWGDSGYNGEQRDDSSAESTPSNCECKGPSCMCCVDFNLTYFDLGGPGCVGMKYVSQQEGIAVNVSYGESLLHSEQVKGPNPEPTCMALLANLAQVCARFPDLHPHNDGLRGCLLLEPKLLGDVTASFNIGCFAMGPEGMKLQEGANSTFAPPAQSENENGNGTESESEGLNEEELIAAVNESAEQGLVFFGNLLGLTFGNPETNQTNTGTVTPATNTSRETAPAAAGKSLKHRTTQLPGKTNTL